MVRKGIVLYGSNESMSHHFLESVSSQCFFRSRLRKAKDSIPRCKWCLAWQHLRLVISCPTFTFCALTPLDTCVCAWCTGSELYFLEAGVLVAHFHRDVTSYVLTPGNGGSCGGSNSHPSMLVLRDTLCSMALWLSSQHWPFHASWNPIHTYI